jgi:hypothetical protein
MEVYLNFTSGARATIRFPLAASVVFWWTDAKGTYQQGAGRSRDISDRGVFVLAAACPPLGTLVGLKISLDEVPDTKGTLHIEVTGQVLRVEESDVGMGSSGFAVSRKSS